MKQVSQLDQNGYFVGITTADPSPLEPGAFLIPGGAVDTDPPESIPEGKRAKWNGQWVFEDVIDLESKPKPPEMTEEEKESMSRALRQSAYQQESDPLFFKWRRGEATEQEWLDKIAEIKSRIF
jgi:hypothetical protein